MYIKNQCINSIQQWHRDSSTWRIWVMSCQDLYVHIAWAQNVIMSHLELYNSLDSLQQTDENETENFVDRNVCSQLVIITLNAMTRSWNTSLLEVIFLIDVITPLFLKITLISRAVLKLPLPCSVTLLSYIILTF